MSKGKVYLVGAGPGRPDLITLRGYELLKGADCIICDKLANRQLLEYAKADAEIIFTPKRVGSNSVSQDEINSLIIEKAISGKTVVRLKGGDPCIFGRGAEEAEVLAANGITFEIVPGITAAIAAAEYSGFFLTDRNYSSEVIFATGREAPGKKETGIDWALLANFKGTIVFYMGVSRLGTISEKLISNGMSPDTPAAIVQNATFANQKTVSSTIGCLCDEAAEIKPPALIIIGQAGLKREHLNWFGHQPFSGKGIVITRTKEGNSHFRDLLVKEGAVPLNFASIRLKSNLDCGMADSIAKEIPGSDWVVFTSANGVSLFFEKFYSAGLDSRFLAGCKIGAIGEKTALMLKQFGLLADLVPDSFTSIELGRQMSGQYDLNNKKIVLLRSDMATDDLTRILTAEGAKCVTYPFYTLEKERIDKGKFYDLLDAGDIHWLTFTSPSSAEFFFDQIDKDRTLGKGVKIASIGPVTSQAIADLGIAVSAEAREHTLEGIIDKIKEFEQ